MADFATIVMEEISKQMNEEVNDSRLKCYYRIPFN
jgi:hypothetical protein